VNLNKIHCKIYGNVIIKPLVQLIYANKNVQKTKKKRNQGWECSSVLQYLPSMYKEGPGLHSQMESQLTFFFFSCGTGDRAQGLVNRLVKAVLDLQKN
jgi:hypothetical protein